MRAADLLVRRRLAALDRGDDVQEVDAVEGLAAGEQLVEHAAEREDVGALIAGVAVELLRRHVLNGAGHPTRGGRPRVAHIVDEMVAVIDASPVGRAAPVRAATPKSSSFTCAALERARAADEHDVARLQVAVHDPGAVGAVHRRADLNGDVERLVHRELGRAAQAIFERFSLEELEDQVVELAVAADVVDRADVRIVQRGDDARLLLEAPARFGVGGQRAGQDLDGDRAIEPGVAGAIDLTHAAGADRRGDLVRPEPGPGLEGHRGGIVAGNGARF